MASLPAPLQDQPTDLFQTEVSILWHDLTDLQQAWLIEYMQNGFNATQAARDAGYQCKSENGFRVQGHENRHHPKIAHLISTAMERYMDGGEAMKRMATIARGDMADFLSIGEDGTVELDLAKAKARGKLHLIRDIKINTTTDPETGEKTSSVDLKLYSKSVALKIILKALGPFNDGKESSKNTSVQQWITQINNHMDGKESPWPQPHKHEYNSG
jgi:hypothetical protein